VHTVSNSERLESVAAAAVGVVLSTVAVLVTLSGTSSQYEGLEALARAAMVGVPIAVGIYARSRPPFRRFGGLLIAAGCVWFLSTLSGSSEQVLYSIGRVSGWWVEVVLAYLVLAFPTGRLSGRADRMLVGIAALLVVVLYLPTALLVEQYPIPSPHEACDPCPENAFMIVGSEPAFVEDALRPLREVLTIAIFAAVTVRLALRIRSTSHLMRRMLMPVLAVAIFRAAVFTIALVVRRLTSDPAVVEVLVWLIALALPAMAIAFLVGVARWRLFVAGAQQRLARRLRGHPRPEDVRDALAEAFDDPTLDIAYWLDGHWADGDGKPVALPTTGTERSVTEILDGDRRVAAVVHDSALRGERSFIDAATSYMVMTLDNHRLTAHAAALLREVTASRARIQATADDERRRIERDLHDGAQQRLVALRIKLELAAEQIDTGSRHGDAGLLRGLGGDVEDALDEIRSLARGIYPPALADRGLVEALRAAALQAGLPTSVLAAGVGRYAREIETAAYFCCLEALQNAAKHAHGATTAVVDISDNGVLHLEIRDDGTGYDPDGVAEGVGLTSMRDRLAAVGGTLKIRSSPGRGTRVSADIPLNGARSP
jgi:signal transduction histidine kinase